MVGVNAPAAAPPAIVVDDLTVTFEGRRRITAVDGLSIAVSHRESFGIVGESGSGKSTVLRAVAGLVVPTRGTVSVEGVAMGPRRSRADRRRLQFVFQDPYGSLHPRHTVDAVLREPLVIHGEPRAEARIVAALDDVGLGATYRFRYPHQLSGGQRQRVALARALILAPAILLLDEPTSALDVSVQAEILNLLVRLREERHLTTVLVSHDLAVVAHLCDRLAVMRAGRLVEVLTAEALRRGEVRQAYTRALLEASRGYRRHPPTP